MASFTCFETEGSSSGRRLYAQVCYNNVLSASVQAVSSTYKTAYTDACKTCYSIPMRTTVFLKMNSRFRNMYKTTQKLKYSFRKGALCWSI